MPIGRTQLEGRRGQVVAHGPGAQVGASGDLLHGSAVRGELQDVGLARVSGESPAAIASTVPTASCSVDTAKTSMPRGSWPTTSEQLSAGARK